MAHFITSISVLWLTDSEDGHDRPDSDHPANDACKIPDESGTGFAYKMKRFLRNIVFLGLCGILLWKLVPSWLGVNMPLGTKDSPSTELLRKRLSLAAGFDINVFADNLPGARILRFSANHDLLVSLPYSGSVILLKQDADKDGQSDGRSTVVEGLDRPHGIDLFGDWLYIAESGAIGRIQFDSAKGISVGSYQRIVADLPSGGNHWSRSIRFGPDGWLYLSIGSSCNVCEEQDPRRAALMRFQPDGSQAEIFAKGLRNTVGFDWHPVTGDLFGVDNGRDFLGDNFPPCELNRIEPGKFYGWPYANGDRVPDPEFGPGKAEMVAASMAPAYSFGAHTAPLGITFLSHEKFPGHYRGAAVVTLHGSWNRSEKSGYRVVTLHFNDKTGFRETPLVSGFERNNDVIGRPVDIVEHNNGDLYLSDDFSGTVYRITYQSQADAGNP